MRSKKEQADEWHEWFIKLLKKLGKYTKVKSAWKEHKRLLEEQRRL